MIRSTLFLLLALFMFSTASYACGGGSCCGKHEKRCKHKDHHGGYKDWKSKNHGCCGSICNPEDGFHNDMSKRDDCDGPWFPDHENCEYCYKGKTYSMHDYLADEHHGCDFCYKGPAHDAHFFCEEDHGCAFDHPCDKKHNNHKSYASNY